MAVEGLDQRFAGPSNVGALDVVPSFELSTKSPNSRTTGWRIRTRESDAIVALAMAVERGGGEAGACAGARLGLTLLGAVSIRPIEDSL
jgi:hypothetical protein